MIYAIGDSFTKGDELPGETTDTPGIGAWPEVLSRMIGKPVVNKGRSASGNTRIVKRVIDAVINNAEGIIICWTSAHRIELSDNTGIYNVWPGRVMPWRNIYGGNVNTEHRLDVIEYLTKHQSDTTSILHAYANWLRQIILVQSFCKERNIPCVMFNAFGAREDYDLCKNNTTVQQLFKAIDFSIFVNGTINESTVEWAYGTTKMPMGHPGPEAHIIIANKVNEHIRHLGWFS